MTDLYICCKTILYSMMEMNSIFEKTKSGLLFAQELPPRLVYNLKQHGVEIAGSEKSAYRRINSLVPLGLATINRGQFSIKNEVISQPLNIIKKMFPSLLALKQARRFGRSYNNADINFVFEHKPDSSIITLDYPAWSLTKFQFPNDLYLYVGDVENVVRFLKNNGFREGNKGHVILLPKIGSFENDVERLYLDCISNGGRSILDAIALQLFYPEKITISARFPVEVVAKVQEDMPYEKLKEIAPINT